MSTKQVTCRYFLHGVCREGSRCLFSHDPTTSKPSTICKYYQRGVCAYGERCRYDHIRPPGRSGATAEQSTGSGAGGGARGRQGARRGVILRDRVLGSDSLCCGSVEGSGSDVTVPAGPEQLQDHSRAPLSYVEAIRTGLDASGQGSGAYQDTPLLSQLCPYAAAGQCHYGNSCPYLHGDLCDICRLQVLHPHDPEQRRAHQKMCMLAFESDMERAFAAQLSQDKVCSICMEVVVQKVNPSERRFGILSACSHTYCLTCIRQWRCAKQFDNKIIKSCPECRVVSEFVIPSVYWVENQDDKNKLIDHFKSGVSKKACKYFDQGRGSCPFGGKCLYLHAYPDGTRAQPDKPRKQLSSEGNIRFLNSVRLWDFIEEREQRSVASPLSLDDDVTELRELFMQMSGSSQDSAAGPLPDPARPDQ
ncbi:E3 ubiquitin-protein ligase makorin-2 isoform X1 [Lampris incognitus]|uniref:E3 ubiquitin-protein ligase makorin-2 isoform X1 n=1 Tax=Lampris incognitus TaxID=2546036 RepID=UPI0024B610CE|nr:E3 ubiquitin-protein ligase makorin-2 isoform X1 [Lampris incognitus]